MAGPLEQFVKQLEDSGVIAAGKLESFIPPKATPKDAQELARQLVLSNQLTKYQVQEIYKGRAKSLILGNYTILDKIGAGGMGQVFKAEHRRMHRVVAIKILPAEVTRDPAAIARFQREVEAAARLSHRNIVASYDANEAGGVHFLAMEYVDGIDLSALVKKEGPLAVDKAVGYVVQAAKGLEFAHAEHVVHRDIKPANLLLDKKGTIKILDMGLARIEAGYDAATQAELTGTGAVLGTVDYMAPEQSLGTKNADGRADIYSLGCTLYYLLVGKAIYNGESVTAKLLAHHQQPIPDLCKLKDGFSAALQSVFRRMVAKRVEDRFQTMSEVVAALQSPEQAARASQPFFDAPQSIDTLADADALTFLNELPARTPGEPKAKKKPPEPKPVAVADQTGAERLISRKTLLRASAGAVVGAAILAGLLIALRGSKPARNDAQEVAIESGGKQAGHIPTRLPTNAAPPGNSILNDPDFKKWMGEVASLPAEQQVQAVVKKLRERNPGFDGNETHEIDADAVAGLQFYTDNVADISPVRALAGLKKLNIGAADRGKRGKVSDLSPLKGLPLTDLNCNPTQVSDLSPLKGMKLTSLDCGTSGVTDLTPLRGMPLAAFGCGTTAVSNLSPLQGMPLTSLYIDATLVADLSPLKGMQLVELHCHSSLVSDLSPLHGMKLRNLSCNGTRITDLTPLQGMPLTILDCSYNNLSDLSPLKGMKLTQLIFVGTHVADLAPLKGMPLTSLSCEGLPITDLKLLVGMPLTDFNCGRTRVADLSPLHGMPLTALDCEASWIADLSPLQGMRLTKLACHMTRVADLSPLRGLPLHFLDCSYLRVSDLSSLQGMPLGWLHCQNTRISDLSPLRAMPLTNIAFSTARITKGLDIIRQMKSLNVIETEWGNQFSPDEFWEKYDAGAFLPWDKNPDFRKWMNEVASLPAEKQPEAVAKKLQVLNPGFEGNETHKIEGGVVTEFNFLSDKAQVSDISPVRALAALKVLNCNGTNLWTGRLSDLSPLRGMTLASLNCGNSQVFDLSPLAGMPLTFLDCDGTRVLDLSPLKGMKLTNLRCSETGIADLSPLAGMPLNTLGAGGTRVADLAPLRGMPLKLLACDGTNVSDLSPLAGMSLTDVYFTPKNITKGINVLRAIKTIATIGLDGNQRWSAADFWKKYDAGEFNR